MKSGGLGNGLVLFSLVPSIAALPSWVNVLGRDANANNAPRQYEAYAPPQYGGHYSYGGVGPQPTLSILPSSQTPTSTADGLSGCRFAHSWFGPRWLTCVLLASNALTSGGSNTGFSSGILTGTSIHLSTGTRPLSFSLSYTSSSGDEASGTGTSSGAGIVPSSSGLAVTTM